MLKLLKNNRGISFLDTLVSIILVLIVITIVGQFQSFVTRVSFDNEIALIISKYINNKISEIYSIDNWEDLTDEVIETENGELEIKYSYSKNDQDKTDVLGMNVKIRNFEREYSFERSSLYVK